MPLTQFNLFSLEAWRAKLQLSQTQNVTQAAPLGLIPSAAIPAENSRLRLDTLALCVRLHKGDGDALKTPFLGMRSAVISSHSGGRQRTPSSPRLPMAVAEQHLEAVLRGSQLGAAGGWQEKGGPSEGLQNYGAWGQSAVFPVALRIWGWRERMGSWMSSDPVLVKNSAIDADINSH